MFRNSLLISWVYDLSDASVDFLGDLLGRVAEQFAGMLQGYLACGFWPYVTKLKLPDARCQSVIAIGCCLDSGLCYC